MSESNNNIPMRITQLQEATAYEDGMYYAVAKAGSGTKKINANIINNQINYLSKVAFEDVPVPMRWKGKGWMTGFDTYTPSGGGADVSEVIEIPSNAKYMNFNITEGYKFYLSVYDENQIEIYVTSEWVTSLKYEVPTNAKYIMLECGTSSGGGSSTILFRNYFTLSAACFPNWNEAVSLVQNNNSLRPSWELGSIDSTGAVITTGQLYCVSDFIELSDEIDYFSLHSERDSYGIYVIGYDENKNYIGPINNAWDLDLIVKNHFYRYFRIQFARNNGTSADSIKRQNNIIITYKRIPSGSNKKPYYANKTYNREYFTIKNRNNDNVDCMIMPSIDYTATGKPSKLLMICHGSGYTVNAANDAYGSNHPYTIRMLKYFNNNGFFLFDVNGYDMSQYGGEMWGCNRGVEIYRKALQYVMDNYNVEKTFSIYAFSMGGLSAYNLLGNHLPNIKCAVLSAPVSSLYEQAWVGNVASKVVLRLAYEMPENSDYDATKTIGCDPFKSMFTIDSNETYLKTIPPIKIFHGDQDTVLYTYSQRLCNAMKNANCYAEYELVEGADHGICWGQDTTIYPEYLEFLQRFNN